MLNTFREIILTPYRKRCFKYLSIFSLSFIMLSIIFSIFYSIFSYMFNLYLLPLRLDIAVYVLLLLVIAWQCEQFAEFITNADDDYSKEMEAWRNMCEALNNKNDGISPPQF